MLQPAHAILPMAYGVLQAEDGALQTAYRVLRLRRVTRKAPNPEKTSPIPTTRRRHSTCSCHMT